MSTNRTVHDIAITEGSSFNNVLMKNEGGDGRQGFYVFTPCTGLVRAEWAMARYSQIIPANFSYRQLIQWMSSFAPLGYLVADAQNLGIRSFLEDGGDWFLSVEQDNVLPPDCFLRLNQYVRSKTEPVVSGLYFTKSFPAEPLVYRGRGTSYYTGWRVGDKVRVDCVPMGCCLIHRSVLKAVWDESEEYRVGPVTTRRVFRQPDGVAFDPEKGWNTLTGTSDMDFCARLVTQGILDKAGWPEHQKMKYPLLIDTAIFCGHIDESGRVYPSPEEKARWMPGGPGDGDPRDKDRREDTGETSNGKSSRKRKEPSHA